MIFLVFINVIAQEFWDDEDADWDGYSNGEETTYGTDPYDPSSYPGNVSGGDMTGGYEDPYLVDTDGDTIPDYEETSGREVWYDYYDEASGTYFPISEWITTDSNDADTDNDGIDDGVEWDLYNLGWSQPPHWFRPTDSSDGFADWDSDGLSNALEISQLGTNILSADSDDDGVFTDFDEWLMGTNPLDPLDPAPETETDPEGDPDSGTSGGGNETGMENPDPGTGDGTSNNDPTPPSLDPPDPPSTENPDPDSPPPSSNGNGVDLVGRTITFRPGTAALKPDGVYDPEWEPSMWGFSEIDWSNWIASNEGYVSTVDGGPHPLDHRYNDLSLTTPFEADFSHPVEESQNPKILEGQWGVVDRLLDPTGLWNGAQVPWSGTLSSFAGSRPLDSDLKVDSAHIEAIGQIYPKGKYSEVWLRRETPTPHSISRSYLIKATQKTFNDPDSGTPNFGGEPSTIEKIGVATFTIAADQTVSSICELQFGSGFPSEWLLSNSGGLIMKPGHSAPHLDPTNSLQGGEDNSVSLLPVELIQPKLDENLEAVKDENGNDELVDPGELRFCRWRDAFEGTDIWKTGQRTFKKDFIDEDRDRIVVRISGAASDEDVLKAFVKTESADGAVLDDETEVEFKRNEEDDFEYTMILVTSDLDDNFDPERSTDSSIASNFFVLSDNEKNDPTHLGHLGGKLKLRFPDLGNAEFEKPIMEEKATVPVKIFIIADHDGNFSNLSDLVTKDFELAENIYEQIGIKIVIDAEFFPLTESQSIEIYDDDNIEFYERSLDLKNLISYTGNIIPSPQIPTIFYVNGHINKYDVQTPSPKGIAQSWDDRAERGYGFVSAVDRHINTLAHEIGHLLGLADNPVLRGNILHRHHHRDAFHYLMRIGAEYIESPIDCSLRFSERDEKWMLHPRSDREKLETAKSYIRHD